MLLPPRSSRRPSSESHAVHSLPSNNDSAITWEEGITGEDNWLPPPTSSKWLADIPFSEGIRRSSTLLRLLFRPLYTLFLIGGFLTSLILMPLSLLLSQLLAQLVSEMATFTNVYRLVSLLVSILIWNWLEEFATALAIFLLCCAAIYMTVKAFPKLHSTITGEPANHTVPSFSTISVVGAGLVFAVSLATARLTVIAVPIIYPLLFFAPPILIFERRGALEALRRSTQLITGHWRRALASLILSYLFITFAGQLGVMLYMNIEALLLLLQIPLGLPGLVLLAFLSQATAAATAPFLPLLSFIFYPGASAAHQQRQRRRRKIRPPHFIPFPSGQPPTCPSCGATLKPHALFCHRCGAKIEGAERRIAQVVASGFCPSCGFPLLPNSQYCDICGAKLPLDEETGG